jgi:hypothetical protein
MDASTRKFIEACLIAQDRREVLTTDDHLQLLSLLDEGLVGMDGFRYMWPEEAKENRRRTLASLNKVHA